MALVNLLIQNQCQFPAEPRPSRLALALVQWAQPIDGAGAAQLRLGWEPVWSGASDGV